MSAVSRRGVLKGGALASAALAVPASAMALRKAGLVVFDSTIPRSRAFARMAATATRLDLAEEHPVRFATLRAGQLRGTSIEGLTRWSDWVALRGEFESRGWRVRGEAAHGNLFRWSMAKRGDGNRNA